MLKFHFDYSFLLNFLLEHISAVYYQVKLRSPASDAGICTNDIIIQIDGKHVGSSVEVVFFTIHYYDKVICTVPGTKYM